MEKVKNSAIKKTENLSKPSAVNNGGKTKKTGDNQTIREESGKNKKAFHNKQESVREKNADEKLAVKKQKADEKAKRKELKRKLKENKKAAKLKRREDKKKRRALEFKKIEDERLKRKQRLTAAHEERLKKRAERKALIKNETKKQRKARLVKERNLKLAAREKAREEKLAETKKRQQTVKAALEEKKRAKAEKKADKARLREEKRSARADKKGVKRSKKSAKSTRGGNKRGYGGWLAAVISLGCATLVLAGLLTFSIFEPIKAQNAYTSENARGFYDLVGYVDNIDVNLSKFLASNDNGTRQKLLGDIRVQSNLAAESLTSLSIKDESKYNTAKFINQTGDYSKYLGEKLISGKPLTEKDLQTINDIYKTNKVIKQNLDELAAEIDENFDFSTIYEGKDDNVFIKRFKDLESKSMEYPHMVYDGAFADEIKKGNAESLKNEKELSESEATAALKKYFSDLSLSEITLTGDINDEVLSGYNFTAVDKDGVEIDAQLSKKGGKLVNFNYYKECSALNYGLEECVDIAEEFIKKAGLKNMKVVWELTDGSNAVINYAYEQNGVICYSDLVKVSVCRERGVVNGMDAKNFYLNHKERKISAPLIKESEAESRLNKSLTAIRSSLTLIPKNGGEETLAYEFVARGDDGEYYVYIDALSGSEADIFKVVETSDGTMLM